MKDDEGRAKLYADIAHPINSNCREMIQQRVIQAYKEEKARSKLPGYVPSYDDFDKEPASAPPPAAPWPFTAQPLPGTAAKVQGGEKPRGPHRATTPQRTRRPGEMRVNDSFGEGIFE